MNEREIMCKELAMKISFASSQLGVKPQTIWKSYLTDVQKNGFKWCEIKRFLIDGRKIQCLLVRKNMKEI